MTADFKVFALDQLQIPEVKEEYDRLAPKYDLISKLIERRLELKLSQSDVAEIVGTRQPAISRLESGDNVKLETFIKVARALNMTIGLNKCHDTAESSPSGLTK